VCNSVNIFTISEKFSYLPWYGCSGILVYALVIPLQNYIYRQNKHIWTFRQELIISIIFLLIGLFVFYYLFDLFINNNALYGFSLVEFTSYYFIPAVVAFFPLIILSRWALGRYFEKKIEAKKIDIQGEGNYEGLRVFFNDLVYIQSADNYIEVTYIDNSILKKALIRTKISTLKERFPELQQIHRSYLINPFHFKQWQVKDGKTALVLTNDIQVIVSKTHIAAVKKHFNFTTK